MNSFIIVLFVLLVVALLFVKSIKKIIKVTNKNGSLVAKIGNNKVSKIIVKRNKIKVFFRNNTSVYLPYSVNNYVLYTQKKSFFDVLRSK